MLVSAFLYFGPNVNRLVDIYFTSTAATQATYYCLKYGDLAVRAKQLEQGKSQDINMGYSAARGDKELDGFKCNVSITQQNKIQVSIQHYYKES